MTSEMTLLLMRPLNSAFPPFDKLRAKGLQGYRSRELVEP